MYIFLLPWCRDLITKTKNVTHHKFFLLLGKNYFLQVKSVGIQNVPSGIPHYTPGYREQADSYTDHTLM